MPHFQSEGYEIAYSIHGEGPSILLVHGFGSNGKVNWVDTGWVDSLVRAGDRLHQESQGYFDLTLEPLLDLWGFGPKGQGEAVPDAERLAEVRQRVGQQHLKIDGEPMPLHPGLTTFGLAQISYRVVLMITISTVLGELPRSKSLVAL